MALHIPNVRMSINEDGRPEDQYLGQESGGDESEKIEEDEASDDQEQPEHQQNPSGSASSEGGMDGLAFFLKAIIETCDESPNPDEVLKSAEDTIHSVLKTPHKKNK